MQIKPLVGHLLVRIFYRRNLFRFNTYRPGADSSKAKAVGSMAVVHG